MPLPLVKPLNSNVVFRSFGVNALPNHLKTGYRFRAEWMRALVELRATYFRGLYAPGLPSTLEVAKLARDAKIKWGMQVAVPSTSIAAIAATIDHIAANAADRCFYIEGVNEPDWNRGKGGYVPEGWHEKTVRQQRAIWEAAKSRPELSSAIILGPSLRDVSATEEDYERLADLGICDYLDQAAIHRYPNGRYPNLLLDDRIAKINRAWPGRPIWITETGYHNALNHTEGHKPVTEDVMGQYAPAAFLEGIDRGCKVTWFELLDNPNVALNDREAHFGLHACKGDGSTDGPPWRPKPAATALRTLMDQLADPGPGYNTAKVRLAVTTDATDVKVTVVANRAGEVTAFVRRTVDCWNHKLSTLIEVTPAAVTLETDIGEHELSVDHRVQSVRLY